MIAFDCRLIWPGFSLDAAFEADDRITALFGPSGSGKSTIIRLIAGLENPTEGRIAVDGWTMVDTRQHILVPAHRRRIGLVFQDALLFPHLSVAGNLTYGRWFVPRQARRIGLDPVVEVLGIGHLLDRRPASLSGGERQRVAIGRALLTSPRLLLMDEPLASLDDARKLEILPFIERVNREFAIPIIYVSHSVEEVSRLAAQVVRIDEGRVVEIGPPSAVLAAAPADTAGRFEAVSFVTGTVKRTLPDFGVTVLAHPAGEIVVPGVIERAEAPVRVAIRATNVTLAVGRPGQLSVRTALAGRIVDLRRDDGPFALTTIELAGGEKLKAYATRLAVEDLGLAVGADVTALVRAAGIDERALASG